MYVCGPTVYSEPHIGNFRSFLLGDVVRRWLEYLGYDVFQVMNITDIDDKTIRDSAKEGLTLKEFTERFTHEFFEGIDIFNIKRALIYPKATENVEEMIAFIEDLIEGGFAYVTRDGVYFEIRKFSEYGRLSGIDISLVKKTERMNSDDYDKANANDFVLWKKSTPQELERGIFYDSPWGKGRPGWHIECSAMIKKYLGETLDIHVGGEDLIFPHHENELAQSETLSKKKFVNFWLHGGFLKINGRKMSKSLGNFITFKDAIKKFSPDSIRYFYLSTHYRKQVDFTESAMKNAENSLKKLENTKFLVESSIQKQDSISEFGIKEEHLLREVVEHKEKFEDAMNDDLDTHGALDVLHSFSSVINEYLKEEPNRGVLLKASNIYEELLETLGFSKRKEAPREVLDDLLDVIIEIRDRLRKERKYELSDEIRQKLSEKGFILLDTPEGTRWKR
jgi:cysteinyl-tRNA synthetase